MSIDSEESLRKFNDWKIDLEWRCEQHCEQHLLIHREKGSPSPTGFVTPTARVLVQESPTIKGQWQVWVNGSLEFTCGGALGRMKAQKFADERIAMLGGGMTGNDVAAPSKIPDPCIFCGGRYIHRLDCPEEKSEGPKLPPSGDPPQQPA